jgi:hypothetical protein
MTKQLNLFTDGAQLRDLGIQQALTHADEVCEKWSEKAFRFLQWYIQHNKEFMTEDVRVASRVLVEAPPSERAWGGVIVRACKAGLIRSIGYKHVKNPKAHMTGAAVWGVIKKY